MRRGAGKDTAVTAVDASGSPVDTAAQDVHAPAARPRSPLVVAPLL